MDESIEMARSLSRAGYTTVYCTPHLIRGSYEADNATVKSAVALLQAELLEKRIDLLLFPGREYYLDEFLLEYLKDPLPLGETNSLLIEIPGYMPVQFVKETCYRIKCSGYIPMIAHPERCELLAMPENRKESRFKFLTSLFLGAKSNLNTHDADPAEENDLLTYLKGIGCAFQGNLGSFSGLYGAAAKRNAERLRQGEVYTHFGTDLHSSAHLDALMR